MSTVTVGTKLTDHLLQEIDRLVEEGQYTSRSEALREGARLLIMINRGQLVGVVKSGPISKGTKDTALKDLAKRKDLSVE